MEYPEILPGLDLIGSRATGWGAWSIESGWTQGWITAVLAMRQLETSHRGLTSESRVADHADGLIAEMLPDT